MLRAVLLLAGFSISTSAWAAGLLEITEKNISYELFSDTDCNDEITPSDIIAISPSMVVDTNNSGPFTLYVKESVLNFLDNAEDVHGFIDGTGPTDYGWWMTQSTPPSGPIDAMAISIPHDLTDSTLAITIYVPIAANLPDTTDEVVIGAYVVYGPMIYFADITIPICHDCEDYPDTCTPAEIPEVPEPPSANLTIEFETDATDVRLVSYTATMAEKLIVTNTGPDPVSNVIVNIYGIDGDASEYAACADPFPYFCIEQSYAAECVRPQCFSEPHAPLTIFEQILLPGESVSVQWSFQIGGPPDSKKNGYEANLDAHYYVVVTAAIMLTAPASAEDVTEPSQAVTYFAAGVSTGAHLDQTLRYKLDISSDQEDQEALEALGPIGALFGVGAAWLGARSLRRRRRIAN